MFELWFVFALIVMAFVPRIVSGQQYMYTDLGTLGSNYSRATAVNSNGQVVGYSNLSGGTQSGFFWDGTMHSLNDVIGSPNSANGLNGFGVIVGSVYDGQLGANQAMRLDHSTNSLQYLPLGPGHSVANGVNASGSIVGRYTQAEDHAFIFYPDGTVQDLGVGIATAVNDGDMVTGYLTFSGFARASVWSEGVQTLLGTLGGPSSYGLAINSLGQVAGSSSVGLTTQHAFVFTDGVGMVDLGTLGGSNSIAYGINSSGSIVGMSQNSAGTSVAFVCSGGVMVDLNSLLSNQPAGWTLASASAVSENGYIVGHAVSSDGQTTHAFLLTPVPEPGVLTISLLMCGVVRRRRH